MSRTVVEEAESQADSPPAEADVHSIKPTLAQGICLAAIVVLFLVAEVHNARLRLFWYDELATLFVATQPTLGAMFRAMPADGNPPLYFVLARLCLHLPLKTELALRLPSILAFPTSALAAFVFVRRIAPFRFALLSMCLLLGSGIGVRYAAEGRSYALLLMFTALLLCFWQSARNQASRPWALAGITLCTSAAILSHQYGIIYAVLPIAAGEAIRFANQRRVDGGVLLCVGLGALTILGTFPPMLRGQASLLRAIRESTPTWGRPGWLSLGLYGEMQPTYILLLIIFVVFAWIVGWAMISTLSPQRTEAIDPLISVQPEDLAVANTLLLFLPIMVVLTRFGTNLLFSRYAIGSALGFALLVGLLAAYFVRRWQFINGIVSLLTLYSITIGTVALWHGAKADPPIDYGASLFAAAPGTEPIVVASAMEFVPAWWYANPSTRPRLHYLSDLRAARSIRGSLPEYSLVTDKHLMPMKVDEYASFIQVHKSYLVYSDGSPAVDWLEPRLRREKWAFRLVTSGKRGKLFQVTAPVARRP